MENVEIITLALLKEAMENGSYIDRAVWPNEGDFDNKGNWKFNEDFKAYQPMIIDVGTCKLIYQIYTLLSSEETKAKMKEDLESSRIQFVKFADFAWKNASFK